MTDFFVFMCRKGQSVYGGVVSAAAVKQMENLWEFQSSNRHVKTQKRKIKSVNFKQELGFLPLLKWTING